MILFQFGTELMRKTLLRFLDVFSVTNISYHKGCHSCRIYLSLDKQDTYGKLIFFSENNLFQYNNNNNHQVPGKFF